MDRAVALDVHSDAAVRRLAADPVAEMTRCGLVHRVDALDLARGERGDAGDHLVRNPNRAQRTVFTHDRLIVTPNPDTRPRDAVKLAPRRRGRAYRRG